MPFVRVFAYVVAMNIPSTDEFFLNSTCFNDFVRVCVMPCACIDPCLLWVMARHAAYP